MKCANQQTAKEEAHENLSFEEPQILQRAKAMQMNRLPTIQTHKLLDLSFSAHFSLEKSMVHHLYDDIDLHQ